MNRNTMILLAISSAAWSTTAEACHGRRARRVAYACVPAYTYAPAPTATYAPAPMMSYAPAPMPTSNDAPVAAAPPSAIAADPPQYQYNAEPGGPPAYYYTYDNSGKLIVVQWMDWLFRGGRRAGMPAPPLPIIGRLQN